MTNLWLARVTADRGLPRDAIEAAVVIDARFRCSNGDYASVGPLRLGLALRWPKERALSAIEILWAKGYLDPLGGRAEAGAINFKLVDRMTALMTAHP